MANLSSLRCIRNMNPGCLKDTGVPWKGLSIPRADADGCLIFCNTFLGMRAFALHLMGLYAEDRLRGLAAAIGTTPPDDIDAVALAGFIRAWLTHEHGLNPYRNAVITLAIAAAKADGGPP